MELSVESHGKYTELNNETFRTSYRSRKTHT